MAESIGRNDHLSKSDPFPAIPSLRGFPGVQGPRILQFSVVLAGLPGPGRLYSNKANFHNNY